MDLSALKADDDFVEPTQGRVKRFKSQASFKIGKLDDNNDDEYKSEY